MGAFSTKNSPALIKMFFIIVLLGIGFRIWASAPTWLHYDENYYLNIAQNYVDRGDLTPYMWRLGAVNIIAGSGSGYGIMILIGWLKWVGDSLFWGRMLMVSAGLISAAVMFFTAKLWWRSSLAGFVAFGFGLVSTSAFYTLTLRMDALGILADCLVLWLHIYAVRTAKKWLHFWVGVAAILTVEFHVLGLFYVGGLSLVYAYFWIQEIRHKKQFRLNSNSIFFGSGKKVSDLSFHPLCGGTLHHLLRNHYLFFFLGAFLAGIGYLGLHVLPNPEAYFVITQECTGCNENPLVTEILRILRLVMLRPHEVAIGIGVTVAALRRKSLEDRRFLALLGGWLVAQFIFAPPAFTHYTNHIWPILALGTAGWMSRPVPAKIQTQRLWIGSITGLLFLGLNIGLHLAGNPPYLLSYPVEMTPAMIYVQEHIPQDSVVMGRVQDFYVLKDFRNYVTYRDGTQYGAHLRGESMLDFWQSLQPEVILLRPSQIEADPELQFFITQNRFIQVLPDLWVLPALAKDISP